MSYLGDFLFSPERARSPVKSLSGGERNRLLLARLFARPANLLVLDEPTNDLDVETLELLEALIADYAGTVVLVSHDRAFLDNVVTQVIAFEGEGRVKEYVGGYDDWLRQRKPLPKSSVSEGSATRSPTRSVSEGSAVGRRRLTFKERKELESLPATIAECEAEIVALHGILAEPSFYQQPGERIAQETARLKLLDEQLAAAYSRWEELTEFED
jgi:ATP-binding cassette subfamily F protein uup